MSEEEQSELEIPIIVKEVSSVINVENQIDQSFTEPVE
jgi:hypothetical protein